MGEVTEDFKCGSKSDQDCVLERDLAANMEVEFENGQIMDRKILRKKQGRI